MNIETITMDPEVARQAFRDYRAAVKLNRDTRRRKEDEQVAAAYKAVAKGHAVLDLDVVIKAAGLNAAGYPMLAFGRADQEWCWVNLNHDGSARMAATRDGLWTYGRQLPRTMRRDFVAETFLKRPRALTGKALTPSIPPALRPRHALSGYHILWEAVWEPAPPVDPMLLKHLGGALYAVLAAWDLTKIEQAVLRGRLTA